MKRIAIVGLVLVALAGCTTAGYYQLMGGYDNANVRIGMTVDEWLEVENRPNDINRTVTRDGTSEQWVYYVSGYDVQYVYFENGILVAYQSY